MKRILSFLLSLLLMMSMLPAAVLATDGTAIEATDAPVVEETTAEDSAVQEPELPAGTVPTNFRWDKYFWNGSETDAKGSLTFDAAEYENHLVQFFKKAEAEDEEDTFLFSVKTFCYPYESSVSANLFARDLVTPIASGTYYAVVTPLGDGQNTGEGEPVKSPEWSYTRPSVTLTTSNPQWDEVNQAVTWTNGFTDTSAVERYWVRYYCNPSENSFSGAEYVNGQNYLPTDTPPYVIPKTILTAGGDGWYFFTVQAWTGDVTKAVSGEASDVSSGLYFDAPDPDLSVTNAKWGEDMTLTWTDTSLKPEAVDRYYVLFYCNPNNNSFSGAEKISGYNYYANNAPHTVPTHTLENGGAGWWFFKVQARATSTSGVADSQWSDFSDGYYYTPVLPEAPQATNLQWHRGYRWDGSTYDQTGLISFNGSMTTDYTDYVIELFRKDPDGDVSVGKIEETLWSDRNWVEVDPFAYFADDMESGTYYFTVTALAFPGYTVESALVQSDDWTYTRPAAALQVSDNAINADLSASWALNGDPNVLQCYEIEFTYMESDASTFDPHSFWGSNYWPDEPPLYIPDDFLDHKGEGNYYFRIRALTEDVTVAVPSQWTNWSEPVAYTEPSSSLSVSNPCWTNESPAWEDTVTADAPLLYYQIRYYYGKTADSINYDQCVWDTTYAPEDLPAQLPSYMLSEYGEGYYTFKVKAVSSDPANLKSSAWSDASAPLYIASLPKLGAPTDLAWHIDYDWDWDDTTDSSYQVPFERKGSISFKRPVDENGDFADQGHYDIQVYRIESDGTIVEVNNAGRGIGSTSTDTHVSDQNFIYGDFPSGTYYFKVRCRADNSKYAPSDWVDSRDFPNGIYEYKQAETRLPAPTGLYWDDRTFTNWESGKPELAALWSPVENAVYYGVDFKYAVTEDGTKMGGSGSRDIQKWGSEPLHDTVGDWITGEYGENWYFFHVQAFPANIEEYRVSEWSSYSIGYPMGFVESNAQAKLDNTINSLPTSGTLSANDIQAVQNAVASIPLLDEAMMADNDNSGTVEKIETLEKAIGQADVDVTHAPAGFDANKVQVTGAVLNAGGDATLEIGSVDENGVGGPSDLIHTQYHNTIPFTLNINGAQDTDSDPSNGLTLAIPVKITLPIPGNINPAFLVVLHYKQSIDQWEELHMPHVYQENGQWYAAFTVTSMSPFTLAEKQVDVWSEGDCIRVTAHLASGNDETQYLCAVYSTDGQMLGINILDPHSSSVRVMLDTPAPDNYDVKIIAVASGNGWMPISDAQTIEIRNFYE